MQYYEKALTFDKIKEAIINSQFGIKPDDVFKNLILQYNKNREKSRKIKKNHGKNR